MDSLMFIVNPFSGTSSKKDFEKLILENLDKNRFDYVIRYTEAPQHAITLAREAVAANYNFVVAVGGDGTVNEIASVLVNTNTVLGIIPGGSGNGLAMHLGIGRNQKKAIDIFNVNKATDIDTCKVNEHFFINVSGIGFDARVTHSAKFETKRGLSVYLKKTLSELRNYSPLEAKVEFPKLKKTVEGKYAIIEAANGPMYGYNFKICPPAVIDDGMMDVILLRDSSIFKYLLNMPLVLSDNIHKSKLIDHFRCDEMVVTIKNEDILHVDGESYPSELRHHYRIFPKSIKVVFPN
ncbi:MAG TPA: diacylglycerol kinase family lipid kinase [Saprospiraceae bacterium]|nr:diacylglycerol kinase family lipid kinase [Saprospiraceae bacterium]